MRKFVLAALSLLSAVPALAAGDQTFISWVDALRVRETPSLDGRQIAILFRGDRVVYLNEESANIDKVNLDAGEATGSWFKVKTKKGVTGWVFSGGLSNILRLDEFEFYTQKDRLVCRDAERGKLIQTVSFKPGEHGFANFVCGCSYERFYFISVKFSRSDDDAFSLYVFFDSSQGSLNLAKTYSEAANFVELSPNKKFALFEGGGKGKVRSIRILGLQGNGFLSDMFIGRVNKRGSWSSDDSIDLEEVMKCIYGEPDLYKEDEWYARMITVDQKGSRYKDPSKEIYKIKIK
jgi:hypothetical protein